MLEIPRNPEIDVRIHVVGSFVVVVIVLRLVSITMTMTITPCQNRHVRIRVDKNRFRVCILLLETLISQNFSKLRRQSSQNVVDTEVDLTHEFGLKLGVSRNFSVVVVWRNFSVKTWPYHEGNRRHWFHGTFDGTLVANSSIWRIFLEFWQKSFGAHPGLLDMIRAQSLTRWFDGIFLAIWWPPARRFDEIFGKTWDLTTLGECRCSASSFWRIFGGNWTLPQWATWLEFPRWANGVDFTKFLGKRDLTTEGKLARNSTDHFDLRC